jgi:hypothetical protein
MFGWVLFRAGSGKVSAGSFSDVPLASNRLWSLLGFGPSNVPSVFPAGQDKLIRQAVALGLMLLLVLFAPNTKQWIESRPLSRWRAVLLGFLFFVCVWHLHDVLLTHKPQPFIYFQFYEAGDARRKRRG